jgi:2-C-methyl-D-erythritol 2,4-cyclodiphosphate synthase
MGPDSRVGIGFDFHPFSAGRRLVLGGVHIPFEKGLQGHSDADALLHAVTDAILGAAGLADIGTHFPDDDPRFRDASSQFLLEEAFRWVRERGFRVGNVDIVVVAEVPKIQPHIAEMKSNIARILKVQPAEVGIKATTMEGRGVIGRAEGIAVQAVALLHADES